MAVMPEILRSSIVCFAQEIARTSEEELARRQPRQRGRARPKTKREILMAGLLSAAEMLNEQEAQGRWLVGWMIYG
jgi:hypothetical protein